MSAERNAPRDWHRLFGLLLTDFFTDTPFTVEVERDVSEQQQFLDVVIVRRGRGGMVIRLPDGLDDLVNHNLITFKSHQETLDAWAIKELIGHYVAYRKLVSPSPAALLAEDQFRLYAVSARFPDKLAGQIPWQERQPGVYDCQWGMDWVRVVVAGQLPREAHNAALHLFSASPELVGFGQSAYQRHSSYTSLVLKQLLTSLRAEGIEMSYTMEDFKRDMFRRYFKELTGDETREMLEALQPEERRQVLAAFSTEDRLAGLSPKQIKHYLDNLAKDPRAARSKPRRRK